jgi:nucleoside 2-deoxyribosyltransferase
MAPPRIYLAGPEVFLPDALAVGAHKVAVCAEFGLQGVFPLDAGLDLASLASRRRRGRSRGRTRG